MILALDVGNSEIFGGVFQHGALSIRFRKPGKTTLTAVMRIDDAELAEVQRLMTLEPKLDRTYRVELVDAEGVIHAEVDKVVQVRRK